MEVVQTMVTSTRTKATEIISLLAEVRAYQVSLVQIIVDTGCRLKRYPGRRIGAARAKSSGLLPSSFPPRIPPGRWQPHHTLVVRSNRFLRRCNLLLRT